MRYRFFMLCLNVMLLVSIDVVAAPPPGAGPPNPPAGFCRNTAVIATNTGISFGDIAVTSIPGAVTVDPGGIVTGSGGVILLGGISNSAVFDVTGCAGFTYNIVLPASVTLTSTTGSMIMDNIISIPSGTGILDATGYQQMQVGARLNVGAGQVSGSYSGSFTVEVIFN